MGSMFTLGSAMTPIELDLLPRLFVGLFGLFMVITAAVAKDKTLERWFGGL
jgi:hypothetical protein